MRYYHPNALPAHIREQLPNPSRPIDEPVLPAINKRFDDKFNPIYQALSERSIKKNTHIVSLFPKPITVETVLNFLKQQQNQPSEKPLILAEFIKYTRPLGLNIIETVVTQHAEFYPNQAESRILMTAQLWQNLVAIYLLLQCKTRKTLNHDLTLQTLNEQMNGYIGQNRREIEFLTYNNQLGILPDNVAFAILALDGKISKKGEIGERVTNLSANNFLSHFK